MSKSVIITCCELPKKYNASLFGQSKGSVWLTQTFMHSSSFALFGIVGVQITLIVCTITSCEGGMNFTITPCFYNSIFRLFIRFVNQTSEYNGNSIKCCRHPNCAECMTVLPVAQYRRKSFCIHIFGHSKHFWTIHLYTPTILIWLYQHYVT